MGVPLPEEGVRRSNRGRSLDRRDVWVGLKPTERLRNEPWSSKRSLTEQLRPLFGVTGEGALKKERKVKKERKNGLRRSALLEISGYRVNQTLLLWGKP